MNRRNILTRKTWLAAVCVLALALLAGHAGAGGSALSVAWAEWEDGNIERAEKLASAYSGSDEGRHLLLVCACVKGQYEKALELYRKIDPSYARYDELNLPVAMSYLHSGRYEEARNFARERDIGRASRSGKRDSASAVENSEALFDFIWAMAEHPLSVSLDTVSEIPFARYPLADSFPPFRVEINGKKMVANLDTGGAFLYMGPKQAKKLGIEIERCSTVIGNNGRRVTEYEACVGIAESFRIGDAHLTNVPVSMIPTLDLPFDFAIFGTSVFEQFLTTMDYTNKRLILSPRNNPAMREKHLDRLGKNTVEMPFYHWGTHLMFAKGGVGNHENLNFVVDTGLVDFRWDNLRRRQVAFIAQQGNFVQLGGPSDSTRKDHFELSLSLGPVKQDNCILKVEPPQQQIPDSLGGVRIDGFICHAFIKNFSWTIDFDEGRYIFIE